MYQGGGIFEPSFNISLIVDLNLSFIKKDNENEIAFDCTTGRFYFKCRNDCIISFKDLIINFTTNDNRVYHIFYLSKILFKGNSTININGEIIESIFYYSVINNDGKLTININGGIIQSIFFFVFW